MHCATATGQLEATKLIVQNLKVNKYPKDQKGRTPLHYAALNGYINVVKFLINTIENERPEDQIGPGNAEERCRQLKRSQKNPSDNYHATALHYAAGAGHLDIVQVLVQVEEQDHPQDVNGCTPLHWACLYGQVDVVRYLFKHEDKFFKCRFERTALHYAACGGNIPTFEFVFDKYPWFQAMDRDGKTALHHAAAFGNIHVVAFLLEKIEENFYEVNIKDSNGETPMHYAAKRGHFNVVFALTNSVIEKNPKDTKVERW